MTVTGGGHVDVCAADEVDDELAPGQNPWLGSQFSGPQYSDVSPLKSLE